MKPTPLLALLLLAGLHGAVAAADLATLFTTPEERQIINANRYRVDREKPRPVETERVVETPVQQLVMEEVTFEYRISGITVSPDSPNMAWINSISYQDGELLEDGSRIKIVEGDEVGVRISAPDGKHYYATSGQMLEVTYLTPIGNQQ